MINRMDAAEREERLAEIESWTLDGARGALHRRLEFDDFSAAWGFMNRVALVAEQLDHHPEWQNVYNIVDIWLTTHDAGEVSARDFVLARAIDAIAGPAR